MCYYCLVKIHADSQYLSKNTIVTLYWHTLISIGRDCVYFDTSSKVYEPKYCIVVIMYLLSEREILET